MQPVGARHQAERARRRPLEGHRDAVRGIGQARDRIVEDVLDVIPGRLVQDAHQVAADDLDVFRVDDPERAVEAGQPLPRGAHVGHPARAGPRRRSQIASACPATPAPEMSTSWLRTEPPGFICLHRKLILSSQLCTLQAVWRARQDTRMGVPPWALRVMWIWPGTVTTAGGPGPGAACRYARSPRPASSWLTRAVSAACRCGPSERGSA